MYVHVSKITISLRSGPNREHRRHELRDLLFSERVVLDTARSWKSALLHGSPEHTRLPVRFDSLGVRLPPRAHGLALLFDVSVWHLSLSLCVCLVARKKEDGSVKTRAGRVKLNTFSKPRSGKLNKVEYVQFRV